MNCEHLLMLWCLQAAVKVQASFRGYQARKEVAAMRASGSIGTSEGLGIVVPPSMPATVIRVREGMSARDAVIKAVFQQLDRDASGSIDKAEFKLAVSAMVGAVLGCLHLRMPAVEVYIMLHIVVCV